MKIKKIIEATINDILATPIDMAICASGYEQRAPSIGERLGGYPQKKIVLGFEEHRAIPRRIKNDAIFKTLNYTSYISAGNDSNEIRSQVKQVLASLSRNVNIVLDITSMPKPWYASFIDEISRADNTNNCHLSVFFTYVPSKYEKPPDAQPPNKSFGPVKGFSGIDLPDLPTAAIIGLGYEPDKALGISETIDAKETFAFLADPTFDKEFIIDAQKKNELFLDRLQEGHLVRYPLPSISKTALLLFSVAEGLMQSHRLILIPLGPKPFSLLCFLFASLHPNKGVSVWRVSSEEYQAERPPGDNLLVCRVDFE